MGFQLYWSVPKLPECFLWNQDLRTKYLEQASMMGFSWANIEPEFNSGLRTPKIKVPRRTPGASPPFVLYGQLLDRFQPARNWGKSQLYKFRPAMLLKMFYGVQDILIQVTDTTQDLQEILCRISLLQDGKSLLWLQQALPCEQLNSYLL